MQHPNNLKEKFLETLSVDQQQRFQAVWAWLGLPDVLEDDTDIVNILVVAVCNLTALIKTFPDDLQTFAAILEQWSTNNAALLEQLAARTEDFAIVAESLTELSTVNSELLQQWQTLQVQLENYEQPLTLSQDSLPSSVSIEAGLDRLHNSIIDSNRLLAQRQQYILTFVTSRKLIVDLALCLMGMLAGAGLVWGATQTGWLMP